MRKSLVFAVVLGFASWVSASDYYGPIYQDHCVYAKLNPGLAFVQDIDVTRFANVSVRDTTLSVKPAYGTDVVFGYNCTENLSLELEPGFFFSSLDSATVKNVGNFSGSGDVRFFSTFANVVLHGEEGVVLADLGLGVGQMTTWASLNNDTQVASVPVLSAGSVNSTLAFQLKAGLEFRVSEHNTIGLAYKFVMAPLEQQFVDVKVGSLLMHKIEVGWTYSF
jgi:opacity protein-like surface antigen